MKLWQLKTTLEDGTLVSTIELIFGFGQEYETCIFQKNGDSNVVARYASKEQAIKGHEIECEKRKNAKA